MSFMKRFDEGFGSRKRKALEEDETIKELREKTEFEKGDFLALVLAFIIAVGPVVLVLLFLFYAITTYFFS